MNQALPRPHVGDRRRRVDAAIEKLTAADVNAALRKYLKPDEFAYAFAGDFDKK